MGIRTVTPRRFDYCIECGEETVQWLREVSVYSPGSYRGIRYDATYVCSQCGEKRLA